MAQACEGKRCATRMFEYFGSYKIISHSKNPYSNLDKFNS